MKYHTIKADIWEDEKIRVLDANQKLLFFYLFSNRRCPPSGIYKLSIESAAFEITLPQDKVLNALKELIHQELISFDPKRNSFWVRGKIKHHKVDFRDYVALKSIRNDLDAFKDVSWYQDFFEKYPQFIDIAIELEELKKIRYQKNTAKEND